jgi:ribonuclease P protein component
MHDLNKSLILKKSSDFTDIIQNGKHVSSSFFFLSFLAHDALKIGFTSSKADNAVERNHLKRIARELARTCDRLWDIKIKLIIVAKKTAGNASFQLLKSDFEELIFKVAEKAKL